MKICELLAPDQIFMDTAIHDKKALFQFVAEAGKNRGVVQNETRLYEGLQRRENIMSTGIGGGLALPHAISAEVTHATVFLLRLKKPIEFEALDGKPVDVVIALIIPEKETTLHLRILASVSRLCKNSKVMTAIRKASDADTLWKNLCRIENEMAFH